MSGNQLRFYNTLTRQKEDFAPIDPQNVRMYVCGPTVYDFAHIGNARPAIVFDVLFRLLRYVYGEEKVTYVRNITDVDDKINARALKRFGSEVEAGSLTLNEAIRKVTEETANQYFEDVKALGCLDPTQQPRATDFVLPRDDGKTDMTRLIQTLLDKGNAYVATGDEGREVLFDVASMPAYGSLSKRKLEDQQAGARIEVKDHKRSPGDFVLWKESSATEPGWDGVFTVEGRTESIHGRPGWHIECSAMSEAYLGKVFDIHGGGLDLIFPHHENEIAQSRCAHGSEVMANLWMHNGFLQVEGRKMSKSEGNFVTIHENLRGKFPGWNGGPWHGLVLRYAMLMTHYRQPIDWKMDRLLEARTRMQFPLVMIGNWWNENWPDYQESGFDKVDAEPFDEVVEFLSDDLNTPSALNFLTESLEKPWIHQKLESLISSMRLLGVINDKALAANATVSGQALGGRDNTEDYQIAHEFGVASANNDISLCNQYSDQLASRGWQIGWLAPNHIDLELIDRTDAVDIDGLIRKRLVLIAEKNWAEADKIRDDLLAQGIQLKDSKDTKTGQRVTTWEVKR